MALRIAFERFENDDVAAEVVRHLVNCGLEAELLTTPVAPDDFRLTPEVATIAVAGIGVLSSLLTALSVFLSARRSGTIVLVGKSGRRIEVPRGTPENQLERYIALAKGLDEVREVVVVDSPGTK